MPDWEVTFRGELLDRHLAFLEDAGVRYVRGHSEATEGGVTSGASHHHVLVNAPDREAAVQMTMDALRADAGNFRNWEVRPAGA